LVDGFHCELPVQCFYSAPVGQAKETGDAGAAHAYPASLAEKTGIWQGDSLQFSVSNADSRV